MKIKSFVVASLLAVAALSVQAKAVAYLDLNQGRTSIILHDDQKNCKEGFLYAAVKYAGRHLNACWSLIPTRQGVGVLLRDEEGDEGFFPVEAFQPVKDI